MIKFTEKEPIDWKDPFGGIRYPVYMAKDGCEYYVMNRIEYKDKQNPFFSYLNVELDKAKSMLISNGGKYFKSFGFFDDPVDMLNDMMKQNHTFVEPKNLFAVHGIYTDEVYTVFHGTRKEISSDFRYSIYDNDILETILNHVKTILNKT